MGSASNAATRAARRRAHTSFDALWQQPPAGEGPWQSRDKRRRSAYRWLALELGITASECHISMFDEATCARVEALCAGVDAAEVLRWLDGVEATRVSGPGVVGCGALEPQPQPEHGEPRSSLARET